MTELLERAILELKALSVKEQDRIAGIILEELGGDRSCNEAMNSSSQEDFAQAAEYVLNKNAELYRRLT